MSANGRYTSKDIWLINQPQLFEVYNSKHHIKLVYYLLEPQRSELSLIDPSNSHGQPCIHPYSSWLQLNPGQQSPSVESASPHTDPGTAQPTTAINYFALVVVQSIAIFTSVCLSVCSHIPKLIHTDFTKFSVHVTSGRGLVVLWCTSGFVDDVMFSHNGANGPESKMANIFCPLCQTMATVSHQKMLFGRVSQVVA